ncbi:MAG TPA: DUF4436 family protein [Terriglobales bacterium]|nr:DUF4436 family protein [Terriglobales bacterium]
MDKKSSAGNARNKRLWLGAFVALLFLSSYLAQLKRNVSEKDRRSLQLTTEAAEADHVLVSITVTGVNPTTRQLTARLRFRLIGSLGEDAVTPKVPLRLYVNNFPGQQVFEYPAGQVMTRVEETISLDGDVNRYPFDRYETTMWLFMSTPPKSKRSLARRGSQDSQGMPNPENPQLPPGLQDIQEEGSDVGDMALRETALQRNVPIPISISLTASTPGVRFTGEVLPKNEFQPTRIRLNLSRPSNLVNVSIMVMITMMGLAAGVFSMVIKGIIASKKMELLPISMSIALIFGLPALRNIQPGVPPVGVLGDYFSFIWAELFVASAAIIGAFTWVFRSEIESNSNPKS